MFMVYRTLLILVHFLYDVFMAIYNSCLLLQHKILEIWIGENGRAEIQMLVNAASKMEKFPTHLVIVFGRQEDTVLECVRIIGWCVTLGISYISFFDVNGFLVRNEAAVKKEVAKRKPDLLEHINWGTPSVKQTRNGISGTKSKTRVSFLSNQDGKGRILSLTKDLANATYAGNMKPEEVNEDLLNEKLSSWGLPDPDLAIVYGRVCSMYNVLPWHIRTTEFLMLPLYSSMSVKDFTYLLHVFSTSKQRYGK